MPYEQGHIQLWSLNDSKPAGSPGNLDARRKPMGFGRMLQSTAQQRGQHLANQQQTIEQPQPSKLNNNIRSDVAQSDPDHSDPQNLGTISDRKTLVLSDVMAFRKRRYGFRNYGNPDAENQIFGLVNTLISGSALIRQSNEHTTQGHREL
ncbi:hypothetical protein CONLIGDRAFT_685876 [Coniochaeta ligniaria NRRL 30616]|uniref:Uncharacterized protein n=1 Tax=Coniochaeta ligniaria NRRL 30616 TaxID=1408157 RepID=A0A1J7J9Q2_9PEZI|nr:hypothetical protein CONLIGDRAFT_685876 [Coniochaeta ligniaria NRRL 30616]